MPELIHVAAAAIFNSEGRLLLALRDKSQHQGGLWEFPGGKVEPGENVTDALARELYEELGIHIDTGKTQPLIQVPYHYPDKSVLLDVFRVEGFTGAAWGKEGQPIEWVDPDKLSGYAFPAANQPIVDALLLPETIAITPALTPGQYPDYIERLLESKAGRVMVRAKHLSDKQQVELFYGLRDRWAGQLERLLFNSSVEVANQLGVDMLHLSSDRLNSLKERSEFKGRWLGASCHNEVQISQAVEKGVDYITLSPVNATESHPDAEPLGWQRFSELAMKCPVPVYALGGIGPQDLQKVRLAGGQGVAGISGFKG